MKTEIEAKFLDIDINKLRTSLKSSGAKLITPERLMKRKILDFPDGTLNAKGGWVRIRDEGNKITASYKQLSDRTLYGTKEVNLEIDNFEAASDFMSSLGLMEKSYQETKRESWELNGCEIEIDTWPWVPTYVEIESENEKDLRGVVDSLGLDWTKALHGSVEVVYQAYYDITESEINNLKNVTFDGIPDLLKSKRKISEE